MVSSILPKKQMKLIILSFFFTQDSDFFGRIDDTIICFRDCLTVSDPWWLKANAVQWNQRPDQYKMKILVFSIQYDFQILKYQYQYSIWRILNKTQYQYAEKTEVSVFSILLGTKPRFGIGNQNQDQVSVSVLEPKLFLPKPKLPPFFRILIENAKLVTTVCIYLKRQCFLWYEGCKQMKNKHASKRFLEQYWYWW